MKRFVCVYMVDAHIQNKRQKVLKMKSEEKDAEHITNLFLNDGITS